MIKSSIASQALLPMILVGVLSSISIPSFGQSNQFVVPESQLKKLGIQTIVLASTTGKNGNVLKSYPAQVVAPTDAEQVVSSSVAGLVQKIYVQPNQNVKAGAPLVSITSPELGQLQLQLLQGQTQARLALQTAQRERKLFSEGIIPKRRVQEAEAELQQAEANLQYAKSTLQMGGMSAGAINTLMKSGKLQSAITLSASKSGVISGVALKLGQRVEPATDLMHIVQMDNLALDIQIPIAESTNWKSGTRLMIQGKPGLIGSVISTNPTASSSSQTVSVRAALKGQTNQVRFGEYLKVNLPVSTTPGGWDLPLSALAYKNSQAYVFVRTTKGFEARPVTVTASAGQRVQVKGNLQSSDKIAVSSVVALKGAWMNPKESP